MLCEELHQPERVLEEWADLARLRTGRNCIAPGVRSPMTPPGAAANLVIPIGVLLFLGRGRFVVTRTENRGPLTGSRGLAGDGTGLRSLVRVVEPRHLGAVYCRVRFPALVHDAVEEFLQASVACDLEARTAGFQHQELVVAPDLDPVAERHAFKQTRDLVLEIAYARRVIAKDEVEVHMDERLDVVAALIWFPGVLKRQRRTELPGSLEYFAASTSALTRNIRDDVRPELVGQVLREARSEDKTGPSR